MAQPIRKKSGTFQKPRSKTVKKKVTPKAERDKRLPAKPKVKRKYVRHHEEFGTSKLEERFARDFLEKLGIPYIYQFKAQSIGRYFDFYLPEDNMLIEVDGDFYHSYGLVYEQMSPMQKKNKRVDEQKNHWAIINSIPLLRIWEHDINNHPEAVRELLLKECYTAKRNKIIADSKKKRRGNDNKVDNTCD